MPSQLSSTQPGHSASRSTQVPELGGPELVGAEFWLAWKAVHEAQHSSQKISPVVHLMPSQLSSTQPGHSESRSTQVPELGGPELDPLLWLV
jgi:hypothetical protein